MKHSRWSPAHLRLRHRDPKPRPLRTGHVRVGGAVLLTPAEIRELRQRAVADGRTVAGYTAWLLAQDPDRPGRQWRMSVRAAQRDRRVRMRIALLLPIPMRNRLRRKAAAEVRSVSGLVARVIVEVLANN